MFMVVVNLYVTCLMFVPAACVFGASEVNWQNVLSHSIYCRPTDVVDYMISAPAHGAVIGAWLGAWPTARLGKTLAGMANMCYLWFCCWAFDWNGNLTGPNSYT